MKGSIGAIGAAVLCAAAGAAQGAIEVYASSLAPEAVGATGTGWVTVTLDTDTNTMRVEATFSGLSGNTTASHIHAATTIPDAGTAGVATTTPSFVGFPLGVKSGSFDQTYDMTQASSYRAAYLSGFSGNTAAAFAFLRQAIIDRRAYLNVHSSTFPGGEIRGFLPTPGAAGVLVLGGLVAGRRRR